ncbi:ionotropic receptor 75a-like [Leguminivora glycinivorella]|uniref:ionotropic receptor 75a-like n=1 Tax=Leguminivora glycinivorella TaxID=1035111 RepID=UPI00200CAE74|nr:ionotropic receptor 75a-like [Leguminivora glycinivorella]
MLRKSIIFCLLSSVASFEHNVIDFSLDLLKARDVKSICLLTCGDRSWYLKFAINASKVSIAVSHVGIDDSLSDLDSLGLCLNPGSIDVGVLIDTKCPLYEEVLIYASKKLLFNAYHKWLVINVDTWMSNVSNSVEMNENMSRFIGTFQKLNLSVDADITLSLQKGSENNIYEVYNFGKIRGGDVVVKKVGNWRNKTDLINNLNAYKYYRRWDFENSTINYVGVMSTPPREFDVNMLIEDVPAPGVAVVTTIGTRVLVELAELHNIRYNYTIVDRWIGKFERNATPAVATSIYFKDQDVTPVLRVTSEIFKRVGIVSSPVSSIETRYYYRIPTTGPGKFENQFLRPLTNGVWGCVVAVIFLCALVLFLTARAERRPAALQYAVFSVAATFCQQFFEDGGVDESGRESSARQLTVLVTGTSCVLIYNYYTSSVVSWLLNGPPPSINSLQELLESPLCLIYEDIGYTRSWLQNPTYYYNKKNAEVEDKLKFKVFRKKKGEPLLVPLEKGIEMVKAGGYAYHTEVYNANMLISRNFNQEELCELGSLQSMEKTDLYMAIPKDSPYKEFFNWNILRLFETGVVSHIQRQAQSPEISCEGSSPRALALGGAAPAFLLLAFGYLLAVIIVLIERLVARNELKLIKNIKNRMIHGYNY